MAGKTKTKEEIQYTNPEKGKVYIIRNTKSGLAYIGQTFQSMKERMRHHLSSRGEERRVIGDAIQQDGPGNFTVTIIAEADTREELNELERLCIQVYNTEYPNGYNLTKGGVNSFSELNRNAISNARIGLTLTDSPRPLKRRARGIRPDVKNNKKPVIGTHLLTGEVIELPYLSCDDRFDPRLISAVCRGKRRHHRGYSWRYA